MEYLLVDMICDINSTDCADITVGIVVVFAKNIVRKSSIDGNLSIASMTFSKFFVPSSFSQILEVGYGVNSESF